MAGCRATPSQSVLPLDVCSRQFTSTHPKKLNTPSFASVRDVPPQTRKFLQPLFTPIAPHCFLLIKCVPADGQSYPPDMAYAQCPRSPIAPQMASPSVAHHHVLSDLSRVRQTTPSDHSQRHRHTLLIDSSQLQCLSGNDPGKGGLERISRMYTFPDLVPTIRLG